MCSNYYHRSLRNFTHTSRDCEIHTQTLVATASREVEGHRITTPFLSGVAIHCQHMNDDTVTNPVCKMILA